MSACGHAVVAALLLVAGGFGNAPTPSRGPVIAAELVTLAPPRPPASAPPEPVVDDDRTSERPPSPPATVKPTASTPSQPTPPAPRPEPAAPDVAHTPSTEQIPPPTEPATPTVAEAASETVDAAPTDEAAPPPIASTDDTPPPAAPAQQPLDPEAERLFGRRLASWTGRFEPGEPTPTLHWRQDGQQYTAVLHELPNSDVMGMAHVAVDVSTERDGRRVQTELRMTRLAFSSFAQFIDHWDPGVQIHDDEIDGRFHSNSEIHVSGLGRIKPVFHGKVTVAAGDVQSDGPLNFKRMFPSGIETRARRIPLPMRGTTLGELALREDRVQRFAHDTILTFYADGSYGWRDGAGGLELGRRPLSNEPHYFIGTEGVTLYVSGTVNGTVLVYTPDRIVITDDLIYAADPRAPGADDYLGLVADTTVEIGGPEFTGPGDLEVQASIYARYEFAVRDYGSRPSGTLRIFGSVAAGSVTATEPRFATKIEFDPRLATMRAPGFPLSDRYELESWSGEWHDAPASVAGNADAPD